MRALLAAVYAWFQTAAAVVAPRPMASPGAYPEGSLRAMLMEERASGASDMKQIIGGSIVLALSFVISLVFYPIITSAVATASADPNSTATDVALLVLLPTLFIVVLVVAGVGQLFQGLKAFNQR